MFWRKKDHADADERVERRIGPLSAEEKISLRQFRREVEAGNRSFNAEMGKDEEHQSFLRRIGLK